MYLSICSSFPTGCQVYLIQYRKTGRIFGKLKPTMETKVWTYVVFMDNNRMVSATTSTMVRVSTGQMSQIHTTETGDDHSMWFRILCGSTNYPIYYNKVTKEFSQDEKIDYLDYYHKIVSYWDEDNEHYYYQDQRTNVTAWDIDEIIAMPTAQAVATG